MAEKKTCKFCKHYIPEQYDTVYNDGRTVSADYGQCRRYPPKRVDQANSVFPVVLDDWWCGEFKK